MIFFRSLIGKDEAPVDSVVIGGLGALVPMILGPLYDLAVNHVTINYMGVGPGAATIIAAMAAGKGYRDRCNPPGDKP